MIISDAAIAKIERIVRGKVIQQDVTCCLEEFLYIFGSQLNLDTSVFFQQAQVILYRGYLSLLARSESTMNPSQGSTYVVVRHKLPYGNQKKFYLFSTYNPVVRINNLGGTNNWTLHRGFFHLFKTDIAKEFNNLHISIALGRIFIEWVLKGNVQDSRLKNTIYLLEDYYLKVMNRFLNPAFVEVIKLRLNI